MKASLLKLCILLGGPVLILIKSGTAQTSQSLPEFSKIRIMDNIQVELVIADRYSIYIEDKAPSQDNIFVANGFLSLDAGNARGKKIKVFTKNIEHIILDGSARIECLDTIRSGRLQLQLDGASKAKLLVACEALKVNIDGGSEVIISGTATQASISADGAAAFKGMELVCSDVTVNADGAAPVKITATTSLTAKADGASNVIFKGNPQIRKFSVDGLAKVEPAEGERDTAYPIIEEEKEIITNGDTTRMKIGKRRLMIIEDKDKEEVYGTEEKEENGHRKMKSVWGGFELGVQGFTTPQLGFDMPASQSYLNSNVGKSWFFGLNLPELDGQIIKNKLAVTTGLGFLWSNIRFDGNDYLTPGIDSLAATTPPAGVNLNKNKLYTFDITAPLLIKIAPGTHKKAKGGFHIAFGAIFHYVAIKRVVTESSSLGYAQRTELNDDFNINSFRADATVRVGFDRIKLFANYSLTPYFNSSKAPDVRLFAAGITLVGF
jgi:hypothetical protein